MLSKPHSTLLRRVRNAQRSIALHYDEHPLASPQARLRGRVALRPRIDLADYRCRAVIDWLEVMFVVRNKTQHQWVRECLRMATAQSHFVTMARPGDGGESCQFSVRFQEARLDIVDRAVAAIEERFGLTETPQVVEMEVSVDFYPKDHSEEARLLMAGVLARHMFPDWDFMANPLDRPRFVGSKDGGAAEKTVFPLPARRDPAVEQAMLGSNEFDRQSAVDGTFYVGQDKRWPRWRVMEKRLDRQNPETRKRLVLPEAKRRARIEVTVGPTELSQLGIDTVKSLRAFSFSKLQGRYFKFVLPTFEGKHEPGIGGAVKLAQENNRRTKFLNTGVIGLKVMDDARERYRRELRPQLHRYLWALGQRAPESSRTGIGRHSSFVAYDVMCRRVEAALRNLGDRERSRTQGSRYSAGEELEDQWASH